MEKGGKIGTGFVHKNFVTLKTTATAMKSNKPQKQENGISTEKFMLNYLSY